MWEYIVPTDYSVILKLFLIFVLLLFKIRALRSYEVIVTCIVY